MNIFIGEPKFGFQISKMGKTQNFYEIYKNGEKINSFWLRNDFLLSFIENPIKSKEIFAKMELLNFVFSPKITSILKTKVLLQIFDCLKLMEDIDDNALGVDLSFFDNQQLYISSNKSEQIKDEIQRLILNLQKNT
jgi:hypothetical protein